VNLGGSYDAVVSWHLGRIGAAVSYDGAPADYRWKHEVRLWMLFTAGQLKLAGELRRKWDRELAEHLTQFKPLDVDAAAAAVAPWCANPVVPDAGRRFVAAMRRDGFTAEAIGMDREELVAAVPLSILSLFGAVLQHGDHVAQRRLVGSAVALGTCWQKSAPKKSDRIPTFVMDVEAVIDEIEAQLTELDQAFDDIEHDIVATEWPDDDQLEADDDGEAQPAVEDLSPESLIRQRLEMLERLAADGVITTAERADQRAQILREI